MHNTLRNQTMFTAIQQLFNFISNGYNETDPNHRTIEKPNLVQQSHHVVSGILSGSIKNVVFLCGAGISTASGIPDFRSPGGMYDTLRADLLTATPDQKKALMLDPTMVVNWELFKENQLPYLEVRRPFILGACDKKWKSTLSHFFMKVMEDKKILKRVYTQNIDGLEQQTGIEEDKIVNVHGNISVIICEFCNKTCDPEQFRRAVETQVRNIYDPTDTKAPQESSNILCPNCSLPGVKPSTILYGRNLPRRFFQAAASDFPEKVDLLVVMGTSLSTYPACDLLHKVSKSTPRILFNRDLIGENVGFSPTYKEGARDIWAPGTCDESLLQFAAMLGWVDDLATYKDSMCEQSRKTLEAFIANQSS